MEVISMGWIISVIYSLLSKMKLRYLKRNGLVFGENIYIGDGCIIDPSFRWLITIGNDVTLTNNVTILAHDASTKKHLNYTRIGKVNIGSRVFIGVGTIILPGVTIGNDVVIAAGSVVTHDIPDKSVAKGNPARVTGSIDEFVARKQMEMNNNPIFEMEYTIEGGITPEKKREMQEKLDDRCGYID
jgi:maltose O-acetyltransferase